MTEQTATARTPSFRTGFAVIDGVRLAYEVGGAGSPVVLLHAGVADARMWDDQFAALAEQHTVVRYDARGCGRSDPAVGSFSPRADLAAVMATLGIARAHLVGLSMGGGVALDTALERPELVAGLVLAAARPSGLEPSQGLRDAWAAVDAAYEADGLDAANELELRMWVDGPRRSPDQVDPAVRERVRVMNGALLSQPDEGEPERLEPPAVDRLGEVRVPTLVLVGDGDLPDIVSAAEVLATGIPGARRHVMPGLAHMLNMERPAEFNRLVLEFLAKVDRA